MLLAALICLCCAGCWRMRRYLDSLTGQQQQASLPMVGVPTYEYEQQTQQPAPSTWAPPNPQQPYRIGEKDAAVEMSSTVGQQPPAYTASAADSTQQQPATARPVGQQPYVSQPAPFASYSQPLPPAPQQYPYGQPYMTPQPAYFAPGMMPGATGGGGYGMGGVAAAGVGGLLLGELLGGGLSGGGMGGGEFDASDGGDGI